MPTGIAAFIGDQDENAARITVKGHLRATESYDLVKNPSRMRVTSASGGTEFPTVAVGKLIIRSESGNNIMFVGGITDDAPYSGRGMDLWGGESITLPVQNMNQIRVCAASSGQMISVLGFGTAADVAIPTDDPVTIDTTRPTIDTVFPASGSTSAELNDQVYADFSEAMASGVQNTSGFTLRLSGSSTNVPSTVFRESILTNRLVLRPTANLSGSKIYVARIGTQVKDLNNNTLLTSGAWFFTTVGTAPPADTTRPVVSGHSPLSGAVNVAITTSPTFTMSESIQSGTVSGFFTMTISGGNVGSSITLGSDLKTVTINPTLDLANSSKYFINALSGVKDLAGNNMNTPVTSNFTTVAPTLTIVYNVTGTATNPLFDGDDENEAVKVVNSSSSIFGDVIKQVRVPLRKEEVTAGTVQGDVNCFIVKSDGTQIRIGSALDAATVTSTFADYTFTKLDNTYALAAGDRIVIEYGDPSSDGSNYIEVRRNNADVLDGVNTIRSIAPEARTWEDQTDREWVGILWT